MPELQNTDLHRLREEYGQIDLGQDYFQMLFDQGLEAGDSKGTKITGTTLDTLITTLEDCNVPERTIQFIVESVVRTDPDKAAIQSVENEVHRIMSEMEYIVDNYKRYGIREKVMISELPHRPLHKNGWINYYTTEKPKGIEIKMEYWADYNGNGVNCSGGVTIEISIRKENMWDFIASKIPVLNRGKRKSALTYVRMGIDTLDSIGQRVNWTETKMQTVPQFVAECINKYREDEAKRIGIYFGIKMLKSVIMDPAKSLAYLAQENNDQSRIV